MAAVEASVATVAFAVAAVVVVVAAGAVAQRHCPEALELAGAPMAERGYIWETPPSSPALR